MEFYPSLTKIAKDYEGFILDLWGVVHDGSALYPGVLPCLQTLRRMGKKIVFLSNAPRRASRVIDTLNKLGVTPDLYDHAISSGEVAHSFLAHPTDDQLCYYYMGPEKDSGLLGDLPYVRTMEISEAKFILNVDVEHPGQQVTELDPLLETARLYSLPMVCVNPDIVVVKITGERIWCAGAVAQRYELMGGEVSYFGKPYGEVYEAAFTLLTKIERKHILAVGDNVDTDILGANNCGIDSALVTGGILLHELGASPDPYTLREYCERKGALPTYVIPGLTWQAAAR